MTRTPLWRLETRNRLFPDRQKGGARKKKKIRGIFVDFHHVLQENTTAIYCMAPGDRNPSFSRQTNARQERVTTQERFSPSIFWFAFHRYISHTFASRRAQKNCHSLMCVAAAGALEDLSGLSKISQRECSHPP